MSSQEPVGENTVPTEHNGESTEESPANGTEPEPQKLPGDSPIEEEKEVAAADDAKPEQRKEGSVPLDKKEGAEKEEEEDDHESVPDDLNDFVVLDEAEITESEGEEPTPDGDEEEDEDAMQWDCPLERLAPRTYTDKQLEPTELDPRCKPDWPLAGYFPVYVGNFRLFKKFDSDYHCAHAVHNYFASKGLPTFMVYRLKDSFFEEYQKRVGFYDMLVYFCNKKDAMRAIKWCHRDLYYGHRLNVHCGRTPLMFPKFPHKKFVAYRFKHKKAEDKLETESRLESYLSRYGKVLCISKQDFDNVLVQFPRNAWCERLPKDNRVQPYTITRAIPKQRFVESNIEKQLTKEIAENPKFMRTRLVYKLLVSIKHGVIPEMRRPWERVEVDESVTELRRPTQTKWTPKSSYNLNVRHVQQNTFKRRNEDFNNGPPTKSRRQLIREAKSLEYQLMRIKSEINEGKSAPPKLPPQPKLPPPPKKVIPKAAAVTVTSKDPEPEPKPKKQKSEHQLIRQRIRGARRLRNRFRREDALQSLMAQKKSMEAAADN